MSDTDSTNPPAKSARGRKKGDKSRSEIEQASSKKRRSRLVQEGKSELKTYVKNATKERLTDLKASMGKETLGDVIDALLEKLDTSEKS
jgi:hypothetical protein